MRMIRAGLLPEEFRMLRCLARDICQDCGEPARKSADRAPPPPVLDRYLCEPCLAQALAA